VTTTWRRWTAVAAALVAATTAVACDPTPPPPTLAVTSPTGATDAAPGDGVCEATPGVGDCTLPAAVAEGNALGAATITVPAGTYVTPDLLVTGRLTIVGDVTTVELTNQEIRVAAGARLDLRGVRSSSIPGAHVVVEGTLHARDLSLVVIESIRPAIEVEPGGTAVVASSVLAQVFMPRVPAVRNDGTLVLRHAALHAVDGGPSPAVLETTGTTISAASAITRCSGTPPQSLGSNVSFDAGCAWTGPGDVSSAATAFDIVSGPPLHYLPRPTSVMVDALPLGVLGCGDGSTDLLGTPRGVDGDGDGVPGCDVGAVERPAAG
jgi:hypothetical protein